MMTKPELDAAVAKVRSHVCKPKTVETEEQAEQFTRRDPCGRVWSVGEKYFEFRITADGMLGCCPEGDYSL